MHSLLPSFWRMYGLWKICFSLDFEELEGEGFKNDGENWKILISDSQGNHFTFLISKKIGCEQKKRTLKFTWDLPRERKSKIYSRVAEEMRCFCCEIRTGRKEMDTVCLLNWDNWQCLCELCIIVATEHHEGNFMKSSKKEKGKKKKEAKVPSLVVRGLIV